MRFVLYILVFIHFFMLLMPLTAFALSCQVPVLDEDVVNEAQIIFEGTAVSERKLNFREKIKLKDLKNKGGDLDDLRVYEFTVSHDWKNTNEFQVIEILRNIYWGDVFTLNDTPYLVVSGNKVGDFYIAHLCGHTQRLGYYQDDSPIEQMRGQINILSELFEEGQIVQEDD